MKARSPGQEVSKSKGKEVEWQDDDVDDEIGDSDDSDDESQGASPTPAELKGKGL